MDYRNPALVYRPDIDGLRAVAVLGVVVFHAFPSFLPGGFVGVDVFFVISGYLISAIVFKGLSTGTFSFLDFYSRRIRRIFPALLLVITASLAIGWVVLLPDEYAQLAKHAFAGLGFFANFVFWSEAGYFDNEAVLKPLLHLWSLGIEEQFYIFWPALVALARRSRRRVWGLLAWLALASFVANVLFAATAPAASYFLPPARIWELLFGAALALRFHQAPARLQRGRVRGDLASVLGLGLILLGFVLIDEGVAFPGWWALLPTAGTALLIGAGPSSFVNRALLAHPAMVWVGLVSFPLYLWHWPLLSFVRIASNGAADPIVEGAAVVAAFGLAWLTYRFFELPLRARNGQRAAIGLVCASVICGAIGANIFLRDGLSFRLKDAQAKSEAKALEWPESLRSDAACRDARVPDIPADCLMSDETSPPALALIGDSHANHYFWGLSEGLRDRGLNLLQLGRGGCLPLYGLDVRNDGIPLECPRVVNAVIDHVVASPDVHTVLLAGRWPSYLTGREMKDDAGHLEDDEELVLAATLARTPDARQAIARQALDTTLQRLLNAGKRVVFLHAVPELAFDARECVTWNPNRFVSRTPRHGCEVPRARVEARNAEYRGSLETVLSRYPQVAVFDPVPVMCDDRTCFGKRGGILLYRDDDHLSLAGSTWVGEAMSDELARLIATNWASAPADRFFE